MLNSLGQDLSPVELINVHKFGWKNDLVILSTAEYEDGEGELKNNDHEETNDDQDNSSSGLEYSDKETRR